MQKRKRLYPRDEYEPRKMSDESISDNEANRDDWPTASARKAQVAALTKTIRDKIMEIPGLFRSDRPKLDEPDSGEKREGKNNGQWKPYYAKKSSKGK